MWNNLYGNMLASSAAAEDAKPGRPVAPEQVPPKLPPETGGPAGPEPTRFGDWEQKGRCTDF